MNEEAEAYLEYLLALSEIKKPKMPKIDPSAYTDNEYISAINELMSKFDHIDDFAVYESYLKGD